MESGQSDGDHSWHLLRSDGAALCGSRRALLAAAEQQPACEVSRLCAKCVRLALATIAAQPAANDSDMAPPATRSPHLRALRSRAPQRRRRRRPRPARSELREP